MTNAVKRHVGAFASTFFSRLSEVDVFLCNYTLSLMKFMCAPRLLLILMDVQDGKDAYRHQSAQDHRS